MKNFLGEMIALIILVSIRRCYFFFSFFVGKETQKPLHCRRARDVQSLAVTINGRSNYGELFLLVGTKARIVIVNRDGNFLAV
jgi:RNase P/RNase MRP subunit p30